MSAGINGKSILRANYGLTVARPAAVLPATATTPYFTVSGGRVMLTNFVGLVTTATSATATNLKFNHLASVAGTNVDFITDAAVASLALGTMYSMSTVAGAGAVGIVLNQPNETILVPGTIRAITSATNTGAFSWLLTYIPLDDGAQVAAV